MRHSEEHVSISVRLRQIHVLLRAIVMFYYMLQRDMTRMMRLTRRARIDQ